MLSVFLLLSLLGILRPSWADDQPTNITALNHEQAPSWVKEPDGRGTWSLVYGCIFTIFLCVWTAVHVNTPPDFVRPQWRWARKLGLVTLAVVWPDLILYIAFRERQEAGELEKYLNAAWRKHVRFLWASLCR